MLLRFRKKLTTHRQEHCNITPFYDTNNGKARLRLVELLDMLVSENKFTITVLFAPYITRQLFIRYDGWHY